MCLSAEVDAAAGLVIGALAVDALRHAPRSHRALAALPAVLAAHQLTEVVVWWGLDGTVSASTGRAAVYAYLLVAFGLPLLVPRALAAVEPDAGRRRLMGHLGVVGAAVAVVLLVSVATGPVTAADAGDHVAYQARLSHGGMLVGIYLVATLGSLLASSHRFVIAFGVLNLIAVGALLWANRAGFISLWCGWAAITSAVIALHLRGARPPGALRSRSRRLAA